MASFWGKVTGEMSKLRDSISGFFGGSFHNAYKLNSSKVDYDRARQIYYNTVDDYKLGAGFAKPIINTLVGFMGLPEFSSQDDKASDTLKQFVESNESIMQKTTLNALREGDAYVWITREKYHNRSLYPELKTRLVYNIIPAEQVKDIILDPVTNEPLEYVLESLHEWEDEKGNKKRGTVTQHIGVEMNEMETEYIGYREVEVDGDVPPGVKVGRQNTSWDFIPIIHFKNDVDETEKFGRSEIEAIEPFLKAYHDVMFHAMQGSKMHSTPRLKLKLKDVKGFLQNNFGITDPVKFAKEGGQIDLDGHEIVMLSQDDEAEFIEAKSATGDAKELLKLLFYCIVDTSETPEFVFGVHTPASKASVKEQMPVLIRNIEKKRSSFTDSWQHLARVVLAMTANAENTSFSTYETKLVWEVIDPRSGQEIAEETKNTVEALVLALNNNLISHEAAVKKLAEIVKTMNEYETTEKGSAGEKERITKTRLELMRMGDSEYLEKQLKYIDEQIAKMDKGA